MEPLRLLQSEQEQHAGHGRADLDLDDEHALAEPAGHPLPYPGTGQGCRRRSRPVDEDPVGEQIPDPVRAANFARLIGA